MVNKGCVQTGQDKHWGIVAAQSPALECVSPLSDDFFLNGSHRNWVVTRWSNTLKTKIRKERKNPATICNSNSTSSNQIDQTEFADCNFFKKLRQIKIQEKNNFKG